MTNTDKRSVFTDALETLGTIIDDTQKRDAIHLAVEPVVAKAILFPGQDVAADGSPNGKHVGIVDPFLKKRVNPGEIFWLVIYPRQIKSLRHVWSHPDFPQSPDFPEPEVLIEPRREESKKWIEEFIDIVNKENWRGPEWESGDRLKYDILIKGANDYLDSADGRYLKCLDLGLTLEGITVPDEFWHHFEIITGRSKPKDMDSDFFTCTC
jgi:hypothetical protein